MSLRWYLETDKGPRPLKVWDIRPCVGVEDGHFKVMFDRVDFRQAERIIAIVGVCDGAEIYRREAKPTDICGTRCQAANDGDYIDNAVALVRIERTVE